jgi:hypothetical protein
MNGGTEGLSMRVREEITIKNQVLAADNVFNQRPIYKNTLKLSRSNTTSSNEDKK